MKPKTITDDQKMESKIHSFIDRETLMEVIG